MLAKIVALLIGTLLLYFAVSPMFDTIDYYDPNAAEDSAVTALVPKGLRQRAEAYAGLMQRQDLEGLKRESDPSILNADFYAAVPKVAAYGTSATPQKVRVLGYHFTTMTTTNNGTWTNRDIVIAHYYPGMVIFTTTVFHDEKGVSKVTGFNVRRLTNDDIRSLQFTLVGKSSVHYAVLALAGAVLAFSLVTFYVACTRPRLKMRWLWVIATLFGAGWFSFSWGNAAIDFNALMLRTPQAAAEQSLYQPMVIHFALPIGCVLFWLLARRKPETHAVAHPEFAG